MPRKTQMECGAFVEPRDGVRHILNCAECDKISQRKWDVISGVTPSEPVMVCDVCAARATVISNKIPYCDDHYDGKNGVPESLG